VAKENPKHNLKKSKKKIETSLESLETKHTLFTSHYPKTAKPCFLSFSPMEEGSSEAQAFLYETLSPLSYSNTITTAFKSPPSDDTKPCSVFRN
jgi:hypothetical protein